MTMKMGLERKLKEKIPEIAEVVQTLPDVPEITSESVETILDSVRPFLAVAGGMHFISLNVYCIVIVIYIYFNNHYHDHCYYH